MKGFYPANYVKCIKERQLFNMHLDQPQLTSPAPGGLLLPKGGNIGPKLILNIKYINILNKTGEL